MASKHIQPLCSQFCSQRGRIKLSSARNLTERLLRKQDTVLALLDSLTLPFDSNQVECNLRRLKVQQTISSCILVPAAQRHSRLRSYLSTLHKQDPAA